MGCVSSRLDCITRQQVSSGHLPFNTLQTKANTTPGMFCCMRKKISIFCSVSAGFSVICNENNPEVCRYYLNLCSSSFNMLVTRLVGQNSTFPNWMCLPLTCNRRWYFQWYEEEYFHHPITFCSLHLKNNIEQFHFAKKETEKVLFLIFITFCFKMTS